MALVVRNASIAWKAAAYPILGTVGVLGLVYHNQQMNTMRVVEIENSVLKHEVTTLKKEIEERRRKEDAWRQMFVIASESAMKEEDTSTRNFMLFTLLGVSAFTISAMMR